MYSCLSLSGRKSSWVFSQDEWPNGARSRCRPGFMEVTPDGFGSFARDDRGQRLGRGLLHIAEAAEVGKQALPGLGAYAGDI